MRLFRPELPFLIVRRRFGRGMRPPAVFRRAVFDPLLVGRLFHPVPVVNDQAEKLGVHREIETVFKARFFYDVLQMPLDGVDRYVKPVGDFLRLCYNNYIIDLYNALTLFIGMASVKSGTASPEEQAAYDEIRQQLNNPDAVPGIEMRMAYDAGREEFAYSYVISSFLAMAVFEFSHLTASATKVVRCQNPECRKFFTAKRTSAKYCPFPSPQNPGRTCNDYYPQLVHRSKVKADVLRKMEKRAFGRLYNDKRRHPEAAVEIEGLLRTLQIESPSRRDSVLSGALSEAEYQAWLNTIRREKGRSYDE